MRVEHTTLAALQSRRSLELAQRQADSQTGSKRQRKPSLVARDPGQINGFTQLQCSWVPASLNRPFPSKMPFFTESFRLSSPNYTYLHQNICFATTRLMPFDTPVFRVYKPS